MAELPQLQELWSFGDPAASESRFREAVEKGRSAGDEAYVSEALTQLARSQGLQRRFEEALDTIGEASKLNGSGAGRVLVRIELETGRLFNSSGRNAQALVHFHRALRLAIDIDEEFLAVDAAHMIAIAEPSLEDQLKWNERALELAAAANDPRARSWKGSLLNNLGWTFFDKGDLEKAQRLFDEALEFRTDEGNPVKVRIAMWAVARTRRARGEVNQALGMQLALQEELRRSGADDGFVQEEIGECLLELGKGEEARPHFSAAFELLSRDPRVSADQPDRLVRLERLSKGTPAVPIR